MARISSVSTHDERGASVRPVGLHLAVETHGVEQLRPGEFPEIAVPQPVVGRLGLIAVLDALGEYAVFVSDAVPVAGVSQGRHGIEKAGREPAEAAVAQGRVPLVLDDLFERDVEDAHGLPVFVDQIEVDQVGVEEPAEKELQGEIIDALHVDPVVLPAGS